MMLIASAVSPSQVTAWHIMARCVVLHLPSANQRMHWEPTACASVEVFVMAQANSLAAGA